MSSLLFLSIVGLSIGALVLGIWNFKRSGDVHRALGEQLKSRYNLKHSRLFSLSTFDQRRIWFGLADRDYINGVSTYGTDTMDAPRYCGVSIEKKIESLYSFDFLILNSNRATRIKTCHPFLTIKSGEFSKQVDEKFVVASSQKQLRDNENSQLQSLLHSLMDALGDSTRYEINYINDRLRVFVGAHFINNFDDLNKTYQTAMHCMDDALGEGANKLRHAA